MQAGLVECRAGESRRGGMRHHAACDFLSTNPFVLQKKQQYNLYALKLKYNITTYLVHAGWRIFILEEGIG